MAFCSSSSGFSRPHAQRLDIRGILGERRNTWAVVDIDSRNFASARQKTRSSGRRCMHVEHIANTSTFLLLANYNSKWRKALAEPKGKVEIKTNQPHLTAIIDLISYWHDSTKNKGKDTISCNPDIPPTATCPTGILQK